MEFTKKKMNKLFKLLIFILIVEISLGYLIYIKNSSLKSGHYISSIITAWVKLNRKIENITIPTQEEQTESKEINKEQTESKEINNLDCNNIFNQSINLSIAGFNSYRKKISLQTNLDFLNSFDSSKDYLIVILGNSETYGAFIDQQSRLHSVIQNKLRNKINLYIDNNKKINNGKVFVVNLSIMGGMIGDHLTELLNFSDIYKPDLAIFYTGGNEIKLKEIYSDVIQKESYSTKFNKFYSFKDPFDDLIPAYREFELCLNKIDFINKENFNQNNLISNVDDYIKKIFFKINDTLLAKSINFLFYIQPFDKLEHKIKQRNINQNKIENIFIKNKNFINLNLRNENLKLDYVDAFHTRNVDQISEIILEDIWKDYKNDIQKKITN